MNLLEALSGASRIILCAEACCEFLADVLACPEAENQSTPKYAAYVGGACLERGDHLDELLSVMKRDRAGTGEDVVIWHGSRVAALLKHDGATIYLEGAIP